ncbi:arginase [Paenibacillus tarimensis]
MSDRTEEQRQIAIIGVPMDLGADRRGVDMGPSAIRCANVQGMLEELGYIVHDRGDLVVRRPDEPPKGKLKYLNEIVRVNTELADKVTEEIAQRRCPLVLGGDHSIAIGTVKGVLRQVQRLGVLWFDAHSDVNTARTSPTGNIHGMPLAVCLGRGHAELTRIGGRRRVVNPADVVIVGARSIDPGEKLLLGELGIRVFTMHDIDRLGMKRVMEETLDRLSHTDGVHLSLDLDGMDPSAAPGVGTPVTGGLTYRESHLAMEMLSQAGRLVSAEVVEVNPLLDERNKTASAAVGLIGSAFGKRIL